MVVPSTPRRSRRHLAQPIVATQLLDSNTASTSYVWNSEPIISRPSIQKDVLAAEQEQWDDSTQGLTTYYTSYIHDPSIGAPKTKAKSKKGKAPSEPVYYKLGDTVLVQTFSKEPSIAVITAMWTTSIHVKAIAVDEDGEVDNTEEVPTLNTKESIVVKLHWFARPKELPSVRTKRTHADNEIYYTLSNHDLVPPTSILSHCVISSQREDAVTALFEDDDNDEDMFVCFYAANTARGLYYDFNWSEFQRQALSSEGTTGDSWTLEPAELVHSDRKQGKDKKGKRGRKSTKARKAGDVPRTPRRRKATADGDVDMEVDEASDDAPDEETYNPESDTGSSADEPMESSEEGEEIIGSGGEDVMEEPKTPSKRRKEGAPRTPRRREVPTTPSRRGRRLAAPTPHSKAALRARKRSIAVRPPPQLSQEHYKALTMLPKDPWLRAMHVLHVAARPDALPCRDEEYARILRSVRELIEEGSGGCDPSDISGVPGTGKTATVHAVVRELKRMAEENVTDPFTYVEINGLRIPEPAAAYSLLWEGVSGHDVAAEGHLQISSKEALKSLTRFFSGGRAARGPSGHACIVLMDELDQLVTTKQDVVYNFFNWPTLVDSRLIVIAVANTMDLPERVMSGRVRSRLGMIRINFQPYTTAQLVEIVQTRLDRAKESLDDESAKDVIAADGVKLAAMKVSSISGDARRALDICRRAVEENRSGQKTVKSADVSKIIQVMQNSPTAAYLRECSLHERMMLAALLKCVRRAGIEEIPWGDVLHQHLVYANVLTSGDDPMRRPNPEELTMVLDSLVASRAVLLEDGAPMARKPFEQRRCMLNLEQGEVERVLGEEGGQRWKAALAH